MKYFGYIKRYFKFSRVGVNDLSLDENEVVPIIKCSCTVSIDNFRNFQLTHRYRSQFVGEVMMDM